MQYIGSAELKNNLSTRATLLDERATRVVLDLKTRCTKQRNLLTVSKSLFSSIHFSEESTSYFNIYIIIKTFLTFHSNYKFFFCSSNTSQSEKSKSWPKRHLGLKKLESQPVKTFWTKKILNLENKKRDLWEFEMSTCENISTPVEEQ